MKGKIYAMAQFFKQEGIRVWADGMVYFTNPDEAEGRQGFCIIFIEVMLWSHLFCGAGRR